MRIVIGCDPNAEAEKRELCQYIIEKGYGEVTDCGSEDPSFDCGILMCGTGLGVSIAANKVRGVYAALCADVYSAQRARLSNDANILCMGAFTTGSAVRKLIVDAFLTNCFVPGCSSQEKVNRFKEYDRKRI